MNSNVHNKRQAQHRKRRIDPEQTQTQTEDAEYLPAASDRGSGDTRKKQSARAKGSGLKGLVKDACPPGEEEKKAQPGAGGWP